MNAISMMQIVQKVEEKTMYKFNMKDVADILGYTQRKCVVNKKDESYIPILFENELNDFIAREQINMIGCINYLKKQEALVNV